jgi:hypothetical protein
MAQCQCRKQLGPTIEKGITADHECAGSQLGQGREDCIEIAFSARMQDMELQPKSTGRPLQASR